MSEVQRVSAQQAWEKVRTGRAHLVCAYPDEDKCANILLEGATSWPAFRNRLADIDANQEIILYCA
jgi:hypothetical protein